ncbi:phosphoglycolate phosphatase [Shewanella sp. VB17]|uniref:phosphoglycolate phosphatase n=1 Tax=Shewanella sp. VB17 TaxID=2739432 RepID=UPI00156621D2|nr:phosphoglycolate phosphatase [Shewanella sp. VB17]NRD75668.1 phosphoglycolate phosphatase [Shewanella sp. VB17]
MPSWDKLTAVAFDLDGTLIDSVPDLAVATQATLNSLSLPSCSEAQVRSWVGNGAKMLIQRALTFALDAPVPINILDKAMPVFMGYYQDNLHQHSQLYPGVLDVLTRLEQCGYSMAVVTNKPYRFTIPLLKSFNIDHYFIEVLSGDSFEKMKPDPFPLIYLLDKWQLAPDALLMVGDSKNDILAAKAAGIRSIGLTYGYNYGEDIKLSGPDAVCEQFKNILTFVNNSI